MILNKKILNNLISYLLLAVSLVAGIVILLQTVTNDIWYDEVFSVVFSKMKIGEMIRMTAKDVHPPLYYMYIKLFTAIASVFSSDAFYVQAAKVASIIPWVLICIISLTYIRKKWGLFTSAVFVFLITFMPQLATYYVEIRMYSLALLFVTVSGLLAYSLAENIKSNIRWILFFIIGMLTAYTQYYACIAIASVYLGLAIVLAISKDTDKGAGLIRLVICACLSVICYIPWLPVVFSQMNNINGNYWIMPLTIRSLFGCVKFIYLPVSVDGIICLVAAVLMIVTSIAAVSFLFYKKAIAKINVEGIIFIMPLIVVIASGFVLSVIGTPIFVYRYMIPCLGLFWLLIAKILDSVIAKQCATVVMLIPFLLGGYLSIRGFYIEEHKKITQMPRVSEAFEKIPEDAIIITNFDHVAAISGYYLNDKQIYLYDSEIDPILLEALGGCGTFIDDSGIESLLHSGEKLYFFGSFVSREDIIKEWEKLGIASYEEDSVLLERYWFNIYRMELR